MKIRPCFLVTLVASLLLLVACAALTPSAPAPGSTTPGPAPIQTVTQPYLDVAKGTPAEPYANLIQLGINLAVAVASVFGTHVVKDKIQAAKATSKPA